MSINSTVHVSILSYCTWSNLIVMWYDGVNIRPSDDDENNQQHKNIDTLEFIDMLEDDDEVPEYTGDFDYSEF